MKLFIILAIILIVTLVFLAISGKKRIKEDKENSMCLTIENFLLIRNSPDADELSKYTIHRKNNELRFTRKGAGYTLFYLTLDEEMANAKLVGLDGYGVRDRAFLKDICDMVKNIKGKKEQ